MKENVIITMVVGGGGWRWCSAAAAAAAAAADHGDDDNGHDMVAMKLKMMNALAIAASRTSLLFYLKQQIKRSYRLPMSLLGV